MNESSQLRFGGPNSKYPTDDEDTRCRYPCNKSHLGDLHRQRNFSAKGIGRKEKSVNFEMSNIGLSASYLTGRAYDIFGWMSSRGLLCDLPCLRSANAEEIELMKNIHEEGARYEERANFGELRLLSYNIFIRPPAPKFTHNVVDDFKDQRLNSFIESYLNNYDIVCLQEMFGSFSRRRRRLIRAAKKRGFAWKVSSPQSRSKMFLVDGGCLILSRVKIVAHASTIFKPGVMSDRLAAKGVLYAKLEPHPGVFVHLFVTHLQAVYSDPASMEECLGVQKTQYDQLVDFVANTVAENESAEDMLIARRLLDKKNNRRGTETPPPLSQVTRRWPIIISGDFNCNSRPSYGGSTPSDDTNPYTDLTDSLSKLGKFSDVLLNQLGEHPVTYAAADFDIHGNFSPRETALTCPEDYHESGQYVNQSLDYIFLFPPTHEDLPTPLSPQPPTTPLRVVLGTPLGSSPPKPQMMMEAEPTSPDSRALRRSLVKPIEAKVRHLEYVPNVRNPKSSLPIGSQLKYLSDHLAIEAKLKVSPQEL